MSAQKTVLCLGLLAATEPSYSGAIALNTSGNAVQVAELPEVTLNYLYDGKRPAPQGNFGTQRPNAPSGRYAEMTIKTEVKGQGAAYTSASMTVPNIHALLQGAGYSASLAGGAWSFSHPDPSATATSLALDVYSRGEKRSIKGAYCDFSIGSDSTAAAIAEFKTVGLVNIPTTVAVPAITYQATTVIPPKNEGIALAIGAVNNLNVKSWKYEEGRELTQRPGLDSNGGCNGMQWGRRNPKLTLTIEAPALSTWDAYTAYANGTSYAITLTVGSATGNKYTLTLAQCQLDSLKDGSDGAVATLELSFAVYGSTPTAQDDVVVSFS